MVQNRRPSKDDGCCSVHFLKYVLFIFNFLFYLAGLTILGVGLWTLIFKSDYAVLLATSTYSATTYALIIAGVLVLGIGIVGCCGLLKEHRCCLLMFTFLLLLIFLVEAVAGILAYIYSEQIGQELKDNLNTTFATKFNNSRYPEITKATKSLHEKYQCCGANNFMDWRQSGWYQNANAVSEKDTEDRLPLFTPDFCCISRTPNCGIRDHPSNIYYEGCIDALKHEIQRHEIIIGAVALGISTIQIFGMVLSCCLYVKLKDFEELKQGRKRESSPYY